jgi:integrase
MASLRLTKTVIDAAEPRTDKVTSDLYLWDAGKGSVPGFGFKVTPASGKSFVFQFRMRGAKSDRRYKIGAYGAWTVDTARDRAKELRRMVDAGTDPLDNDKAQAKAAEKTKRDAVDRAFGAVADRWLLEYKAERRLKGARKGRVRSESTIEMVETAVAFLKKQFAKQRIDEIDDPELQAAIGKIPAAKAATRRNTFASARILWNWAQRQRLITENPFDRLEAPAAPVSRDRVLNDDELAIFWRASRKLPYPFGPAYRLLALTGQRRDEVTGMAWSEVDREGRSWTIPGDRTKNGLPHRVPLTDASIVELDALAPKGKWPAKGLVFTITGKTPVSGHSGGKRRLDREIAALVDEANRDALPAWRVHDLRRTVATGFQRLGVRFEVTEAVMNHVSGSRGGIAGIYQQHDWAEEKRAALEAWATHLLALTKPKIVEPSREMESA